MKNYILFGIIALSLIIGAVITGNIILTIVATIVTIVLVVAFLWSLCLMLYSLLATEEEDEDGGEERDQLYVPAEKVKIQESLGSSTLPFTSTGK